MAFDIIKTTTASALATSGTFTVPYPTGKNAGSYAGFGHRAQVSAIQRLLVSPTQFTLTLGASNITFTYLGSTTIPAGSAIAIQVNRLAPDGRLPREVPKILDNGNLTSFVSLELGAPAAAAANNICLSQAGTAATAMTLNGALVAGGVATLDVPRNIVAAWTTTAVLTFTGKDEYGNTIVESSASGTSHAGKKAFKTITSIVPSANITGATVGTGDVIGIPVFLPGTGYVIRELQDGATATAGTIVAGVSTTPTATTGDVRGTYDPNAACDGAKVFTLLAAIPDVTYNGLAQFAG